MWPESLLAAASAFLVVFATSFTVLAAITVYVTPPPPHSPVFIGTTSMSVSATVTSTNAIQTVQAAVVAAGGQVVVQGQDLTYGQGVWSGVVSLSTAQPGSLTLIVTATDVTQATGSGQLSFVYDLPPTLTVTSPARWSVARPRVTVAASCADEDAVGCTSLSVSYAGHVVASGVSSIAEEVDLSAYDRSAGQLVFTAVGGNAVEVTAGLFAQQSTSVSVDLEVDSTSSLTEVEAVAGQILDADSGRLLVLAPDDQTVEIYDRSTQKYTVIASNLPTVGPDDTPRSTTVP